MFGSAGGNDDRQTRSVGPGTRLHVYRPIMQQMKSQQRNLYVRYEFVVSYPYIDHDNI